MHYPTSTVHSYAGQIPIRVILKFVVFAALGALLIIAQSLALLSLVALAFVMTLAIQERIHRLEAKPIAPGMCPDGFTWAMAEPSPEHNRKIMYGSPVPASSTAAAWSVFATDYTTTSPDCTTLSQINHEFAIP